MIFQCKCCGGNLIVKENAATGTCEYCGNEMTIPRVDDEKIMNLFNRANHLRMKSEFDNAMIVYENIVAEDKKNAEAYWGICLCKYGIEYVTDPKTERMIPTCHRSSFTSILQDEDYVNAVEYADTVAQSMYREEAAQIAAIQKRLLEISGKEEPYDIFICYKESDENGGRTKDSVRAQDIYYELTKKKYRVFFSRISLEGKIGQEYEPYIFSALNSAKIMIVVGTSEKNIKAPWVKNEWSRFLALTDERQEKMLIPVYQDMDPYDMPEEFVHLQALDMGRLGFMQDLLEGVSKLLHGTEVKREKTAAVKSNVSPLLQRASLFLEDGDWEKAGEYAERVLDQEPYCGEAYLVKLLVALEVPDIMAITDCEKSFEDVDEYKKVMQFADEEVKEQLKCALIYKEADTLLEAATGIREIKKAKKLFESIPGYKDAGLKLEKCAEIQEIQCETAYNEAMVLLDAGVSHQDIKGIQEAQYLFQTISDYKDVPDQVKKCKEKIDQITEDKYISAINLFENAKTEVDCNTAACTFNAKELEDYKDSSLYYQKCAEKAKELRQQERIKKRKKRILLSLLVLSLIPVIYVFSIYIRQETLIKTVNEAIADKDFRAALRSCNEITDESIKQESFVKIAQEAIANEDFKAALRSCNEITDESVKQENFIKIVQEAIAKKRFTTAIQSCNEITDESIKQESFVKIAQEAIANEDFKAAFLSCNGIIDIATKQELYMKIAKTDSSDEYKKAIRLLYATGMDINDIAREVNLDQNYIKTIINQTEKN